MRNTRRRFPWLFQAEVPRAIAHRGASDHAHDNSRQAIELAIRMGAQWIEVDVRTTADGRLLAWHDPTLRKLDASAPPVASLSLADAQGLARRAGWELLSFEDVLDILVRHAAGVYVDIKDEGALARCSAVLARYRPLRAILASFDHAHLRSLVIGNCPHALALLVPRGMDSLALADDIGVDIVHLSRSCATDYPDEQVTPTYLATADRQARAVVLWHEERVEVLARMMGLPVFAVLSNTPEQIVRLQRRAQTRRSCAVDKRVSGRVA